MEKCAEHPQKVIVSKQSDPVDPLETSLSTPVRSVVRYWENILNKMEPKRSEAAERAVTKMLWNFSKSKSNDKDETIADATDDHDVSVCE